MRSKLIFAGDLPALEAPAGPMASDLLPVYKGRKQVDDNTDEFEFEVLPPDFGSYTYPVAVRVVVLPAGVLPVGVSDDEVVSALPLLNEVASGRAELTAPGPVVVRVEGLGKASYQAAFVADFA